MEELIRLARENNEMLKRICAYIDRIESPKYQEERQMLSFLINVAANELGEAKERMQQNGNNNQQIFRR